jgi:hypothetical protein
MDAIGQLKQSTLQIRVEKETGRSKDDDAAPIRVLDSQGRELFDVLLAKGTVLYPQKTITEVVEPCKVDGLPMKPPGTILFE